MKRNYFIIVLAIVFVLLSAITYFIHYVIFRDAYTIFTHMISELAFLPVQVFLVVLVIERLLQHRDRQAKLHKLNMVEGVFFSEVGDYLLRSLLQSFNNKEEISKHLNVTEAWTKKDFQEASSFAYHLPTDVDCHNVDLSHLKDFLSQQRKFILTLLQNPSLLEDDRFTDLLWAVTHLDEELKARPSLDNLPDNDFVHIAGDIQRMYDHLASEWLDYAEHLKANYPYLFSLILRTHPFQENPSPSAIFL